MSVDYIGNGNDDGVDFGYAATSKIGFYGLTTPIVQPTGGVAVSTAAATTTTPWGYATSTQADAVVTAINATLANLRALGLVA